jgi:hypothetical protein
MLKLTQGRTGENGNCFATALASILETKVPEFGLDVSEDTYWANVDKWLAKRGLKYERVPIVKGMEPLGWSTMEGISPRGGMHAVVAYNGRPVHDPHPQDGTGRFLVEPQYYGILEKL